MNKNSFVELVKEKGAYETKAEATKAIKAFTDAVSEALARKVDVSLVGFGSFTTALQKGRTGKVPGTNKTYTTQDKDVPKFKFGKTIKERVENSKW